MIDVESTMISPRINPFLFFGIYALPWALSALLTERESSAFPLEKWSEDNHCVDGDFKHRGEGPAFDARLDFYDCVGFCVECLRCAS